MTTTRSINRILFVFCCLSLLSFSCCRSHIEIHTAWSDYLLELQADSSVYKKKSNWKSTRIAPDLPLFTVLTETDYFKFPPKIENIQKQDSLWFITTHFYQKDGSFHSSYISIAQEDQEKNIFFRPYFEYYTSKFTSAKMKEITYYYDSGSYKVDINQANEMLSFNKKLASLFKTSLLEFDFYIFKNTKERLRSEGFESHHLTDIVVEHSAQADLNNYSLHIGKWTSSYPHELVHLYTSAFYPNVHEWFDEGLAEYLGNNTNELHRNRLIIRNHIIDNNLYIEDILLEKDNLARNRTSLKYDLGSLVVQKIHETGKKDWLTAMMQAGATDKDFYQTVEKLLGIKKANLTATILQWIDET